MSENRPHAPSSGRPGKVYLIGAGPGDPGLLTVKGLSILRTAEVVVYDHLANSVLLNEAPETAEKIYVGKKAGKHSLTQEKINALLREKAQNHSIVVRLKGGDPYIFGRGGEEALFLHQSGIPFEVVPGVTAGVAALSFAGIPATFRGFGSSLTFVTGHEDPNKTRSDLNWTALAGEKGTLIFYMGVSQLPKIVTQLLAHGKAPQTPAALVENGTLATQRLVVGTLATLTVKAAEARISPPALLVVGDVVRLHKQLGWFDKLPLRGSRIVITRAQHQAGALSSKLRALGAHVFELPTIRITDPTSWEPVDELIRRATRPDWTVFTSANGVAQFVKRLGQHGLDVRWFGGTRIAAIGPGTRAALGRYGLQPDLEPEQFFAESLAEALLSRGVAGKKIALLRAEKTRDFLRQKLTEAGARVEERPVYQTRPEPTALSKWRKTFTEKDFWPDWIVFTSSSTAENFFKFLPSSEENQMKSRVRLATIGPITTQTVRKFGWNVTVEARSYSLQGIVEALLEYSEASK